MLHVLAGGLADLLWPPLCTACDAACAPGEPFCRLCADSLVDLETTEQRLSFPRLPAWTSAHCRFEFGGQLAIAIRRAKYGGEGSFSRALGHLLPPAPRGCDLVVPVPLHRRRLRLRGFNQAAELVRGTGARPTLGLLVRTRDTPPQTERPPPARLHNVAGAFSVREPERVRRRRVLLVDDVMTTGATADACARALRQAGAAEVHVQAIARAPL